MTAAPRPFDLMGAFGLGMSRLDADLRAFSLGGSDANVIAKADNNKNMWDLDRLIAVKRGAPPEDLSQNIPVMLGIWTEPLNAYIYECVTGNRVFSRNETVDHPFHPEYRCSLDGLVRFSTGEELVWEAKWTSQTNIETVTRLYFPQLQHNMDVTKKSGAVLSVLMGGKFDHVIVDPDPDYLYALRERMELVWEAVNSESGELPRPLPDMPRPVMPPIFMRPDPVDLSTLPQANILGDAAAVYCETYDAARANAAARKVLVENIPKDAKEVVKLGIYGKRNAKGALKLVPESLAQADDDGEE